MSSLMQFNGEISKRGVHLQAYKVDAEPWYKGNPEFTFFCPTCKGEHARLFTFIRKPKGMFGCWIVFRYNGTDQVPDLSCPLGLATLPRDAKPMSLTESMRVWHS